MKKGFKYLILKQKFFFDVGLSRMGYFKYFVVAMGISFKDPKLTAIVGILSIIGCYIVGRLWAKYDLIKIENDISNQFNPWNDKLKLLSKNKKFK